MADLKKILIVSDANRAAVTAALVGVPGGGIDNITTALTTNAMNAPPGNWQVGMGDYPVAMIEALDAMPGGECEIYDTDGTLSTLYAVMAVHEPRLFMVIEPPFEW